MSDLSKIGAAERPTVLMVSEILNSSLGPALAEELRGAFRFTQAPQAQCRDSREILALVEAAPEETDIFLLNCGHQDIRNGILASVFENNLRAMVAKAHRIKASILWFGFPPGDRNQSLPEEPVEAYREAAERIMTDAGATIIDFPGFFRNLIAGGPLPAPDELGRKTVKFFAEALGQWWDVCAKSNPQVSRRKLWPGEPPEFQKGGAERINHCGRVDLVSIPEITRFHPSAPCHGTAVIVIPGGGYSFLGFLRNATELARILTPRGIAVFALKYRTGRGAEVPLLDAHRAVRWVRYHARRWGVAPHRIGLAGTSAGAHLSLSLSTKWTEGDPKAADPVERKSSRPDFVAVFSTWNFGSTESPFAFQDGTPPVFLRHARDDDGFPLGENIVGQLQAVKAIVDHRFLPQGGHGAFDLASGNPGANWSDDFLPWLKSLEARKLSALEG